MLIISITTPNIEHTLLMRCRCLYFEVASFLLTNIFGNCCYSNPSSSTAAASINRTQRTTAKTRAAHTTTPLSCCACLATGGMVLARVGLPSASAQLLWVPLLQRVPAVKHKTFWLMSASTTCVWYRLVIWTQMSIGS